MKKILFLLVVLSVMGLQRISAQNYDVIYSLKMNPESIVKKISDESGMPKMVLSFIKDDIKKAKLVVSLRMTKDKSDMKFLKDQSKFEISLMGMKMDAAAMFDNAGINTYCDFAGNKFYTKMKIEGQDYVVKTEARLDTKYKPVNLYKKILGHECKKMVDTKNGTTVWYAEDIPFQTEMFPGVPGLVLEMTEDSDGFTFTATSFKPTDKGVYLPKNAKEVTEKEINEMLENVH